MSSPFALDARTSRAIRTAFEKQKDGVLVCETDETKRLVFFESGRIVGAKSSLARERLGAILLREGKVTKAQLAAAVRFIRSGRKLGQSLVELGHLRGGEIEVYVRLQILEIACRMLVASPTRLVFSDQVPVQAITLGPVSIGDVFVEALRRLPDVSHCRESVLRDDYVLRQTDDAVALTQGMRLSAEEGAVLDLAQGTHTVADIVSRSSLDEDRTVRLLVAFQYAGMVVDTRRPAGGEAAGPRPAPSAGDDLLEKTLIARFNELQCQNHWQVLGVPRDAPHRELEEAFLMLRAKFDSERYQHLPDTELQEKLAYVQSRLQEAFVTLSSRSRTNVYDRLVDKERQYEEAKKAWEAGPQDAEPAPAKSPERSPGDARQLFAQAQRAFRERDFWRAIELVRASIELDEEPDAERFHLLGESLAHNPRWRQDAEKNLQIAHRLTPWEPRYLISLGMLYEREGLAQRAARVFEEVKAIDPTYSGERRKTAEGGETERPSKKRAG